jgi:hypothetical protein
LSHAGIPLIISQVSQWGAKGEGDTEIVATFTGTTTGEMGCFVLWTTNIRGMTISYISKEMYLVSP